MLRVSDIKTRRNFTYYFGGVEFDYCDMFDDFIIVKIDVKMLKIWL